MDDPNEMFDVVDSQDNVIGRASRKEVHDKGLLHRSVHVLVFDPQGRLFLQKRSPEKDENPGYWDTSSAGHVNAGEDYPTCAQREMLEELGIAESLELFARIPACPETFWEHVNAYTCVTRQAIRINPAEITEGRFWSLEEIRRALESGSPPFTSTFRLLFEKIPQNRA